MSEKDQKSDKHPAEQPQGLQTEQQTEQQSGQDVTLRKSAGPIADMQPSPETNLNAETGLLSWQDLVRFFARGVVVKVDSSLDLVEVARIVTNDDKQQFEIWTKQQLVSRASDDDARDWNQREPDFWALVTAPWVLVQENKPETVVDSGDTNKTTSFSDDSDSFKRTLH